MYIYTLYTLYTYIHNNILLLNYYRITIILLLFSSCMSEKRSTCMTPILVQINLISYHHIYIYIL